MRQSPRQSPSRLRKPKNQSLKHHQLPNQLQLLSHRTKPSLIHATPTPPLLQKPHQLPNPLANLPNNPQTRLPMLPQHPRNVEPHLKTRPPASRAVSNLAQTRDKS